ncbi:MAG: endonuclease [Myxococcales bacterium]|nr:endonuclease [Myxococcales bacterium]MCB9523470.1 endonuclease [Myxococcales bacterium]
MRRLALPLLLALPFVACDDEGDPTPAQQADQGGDAALDLGPDGSPTDAGPDQGPPDMRAVDRGLADMTGPDEGPGDMAPADQGPGDMLAGDMLADQGHADMGAADQGVAPGCAAFDGLQDQALLDALHAELRTTYVPIEVMPNLGGNLDRYTTARFRMFTEVEFREVDGRWGHECAYTGRFFPGEEGVEPDSAIINCEHTWPRSRMVDEGGRLYEHQQSDIHHLLPTVNMCNSLRGSFHFGVPVDGLNLDCLPARMGRAANGQNVFEPRDARKGDVARVVLYFAARWGGDIVDWEEETLKRWHAMDPVDDYERARNDAIQAIQGNRNPFIDCPDLVGRVADFHAFPIGDTEENLPGPPE